MSLQWVAGGAAAACSLYSFVPYIRGIRAGNRPSPVSWIIWAGLCASLTAAQIAGGGRAVVALPAAELLGCTTVAVLAWQAARKRGTGLDEHLPRWLVLTELGGCAVALAWWPFAGPLVSVLLLIGVDFTAAVSTVIDLRHDPAAESLASWWCYGTGEVLATVAAIGASWVFWASSLSGLAVAVTIIATAWRGGVTVRLPGITLEEPMTSPAAPLHEAVADGTAYYGGTRITEAPEAALGKLQRRLSFVLGQLPVTIGEGGIAHERSGLVFAPVEVCGQRYMISLGRTGGPPIVPGGLIQAVTGVCLFGVGAITARVSGEPWEMMGSYPHLAATPPGVIDSIEVDPAPHLSEYLTTAMLGGFLRALAALPQTGKIRVFVHVPAPEYRLFGLWLRQQGLMTEQAFTDYDTAVEDRRAAVTEAFTSHIGSQVQVIASSPLTYARWAGAASLTGDWSGPMGDGDPLWRVLAKLREGDSLSDLAHCSYAYAYLAAAARADAEHAALLLVENPDELPIYPRSLEAAEAAGVGLDRAVGFYIHPPQVPTEPGPYLYDLPQLVRP